MNFRMTKHQLRKCCVQTEITDDDDSPQYDRRLQIKNYRMQRMAESNKTLGVHCYMLELSIDYTINDIPYSKRLLIKVPRPNEMLREKMRRANIPVELRYAKETYFSRNVANKINALLESPVLPSYYRIFDDNTIVMDNLRHRGFRDSAEQMTAVDEALVTLRTLAKFHAAARKLLTDEPGLFTDRMLEQTFYDRDTVRVQMDDMQPIFERILRIENTSTCRRRKFQIMIDSIRENLTNLMRRDNFTFNVLNHGHIKRDNVLIKYDESDKAIDAILVDFQTYCLCTPAADVFWFLIQSIPCTLYENNIDKMIDVYLDEFNSHSSRFNCEFRYDRKQFDRDDAMLGQLKVHSFLWFVYWHSFWTLSKSAGDVALNMKNADDIARRICENAKLKTIFFDWFDYFHRSNVF